ncbi:putative RNA polymerase ECF-subfamily sigma factor [Actinoplanes missouriensis 431]|uniref:Putative RNA polymerase ECF-subfamily sigma factor n=1 Tax=Actinoplanes missouriensis (strain ATCC 14538 / DSM 43046 / CBS 188.64 / JCM 3121 / NBRC 102363 / NCIMB 12654 / NRRL B-3342 / UNCC 431) TaxID=512565 RepID=I0HBL1_ACTM4|nr:sigma-70 family RNA polymerase sigma factor [Actinoplanes missouriensis]BAL90398.1 putative RNA polymerase ECF-subfamily sigma factor [Actinoplanes missouriensis 431]
MTDIATQLEPFRPELTGYCYRMLGSMFEAEDAVQDTMIRAWKGFDRFEGRSALRSWLYRIATNVCLTMLGSAQRRVRPMDLGPAGSGHATNPGEPRPEEIWVGPVPDGRLFEGTDPAHLIAERESVRLAFVAALQHLPAKQRAVLLLREVLAWSAQEVADLLGTSVAGVNSALQRARATIAAADLSADVYQPLDTGQRALLARYVKAFEEYDLAALTTLLHEDATLSMPPLPLWLRGHDDITAWMSGTGSGCRGSRLVPTVANGLPAFGQYRPAASGDGHEPWSLIVLEISGGRIASVTNFLDTGRLFPLFDLPPRLG